MVYCVQYCVVFDAGSDHVIARRGEAGNRQIVRLGASAGKNYFRRAAAQQGGHRIARMLDSAASLLAVMVDGRSVAEALAKIRAHSFEHIR
jgi:hypothetical protein